MKRNRMAELAHHYSTVDFYSPMEFSLALQQFQSNLLRHYSDPYHIDWIDENVLLVEIKILAKTFLVVLTSNTRPEADG